MERAEEHSVENASLSERIYYRITSLMISINNNN